MTTVQIITVIIMLCVLVAAVAYIAYIAGKRGISRVTVTPEAKDKAAAALYVAHKELNQLIENQRIQGREIKMLGLVEDCTNSLEDRVRALEQCWDEYELAKPPDPSIQASPTGIAKEESPPAPPDPGPVGPRAAIKLDQTQDKNQFAIAAVSDWLTSQNRKEFTATGRFWCATIENHTKHWATGPYRSNGAGLMRALKNNPSLMSFYRLEIEDVSHNMRKIKRV